MKLYALIYVATAVVFLACDAVWLAFMGNALYRPILGDLLLKKFNVAAALAFYFLYIAGIMVFVSSPALRSGHVTTALLYGALFGFFTYATYDLTNQATLASWSWRITILDICWGTLLTAAAGSLGYLIGTTILKTPPG